MKKNIFKIIIIIVCFAFVLIVALQKPETSFENASEQPEDGTEEVQTSEPVSEEEEEQIEAGNLNRNDAKFLPLPDLILLDGGKGHLNVITELMDMMEDETPVFGMVKNDKHRTRGLIGINGEVELSPTSAVFKLITHIQDEVHDAAIGYHHKLHEKIESELDKIPGIGEKRRNALLTNFGSIDKIKEADISELEKVVDKKTASRVYNYFRSQDV